MKATLPAEPKTAHPRSGGSAVQKPIGNRWPGKYGYPLLLVLLAVLVWLPRLRGPIDLRYDAGVYYVLGTSIAEGQGYRLLSEPGAITAIQYPPLLPFFTAAHQWIAGTSDPLVVGQLLRLSYAVLFVLLILAVYFFARRFLSPGLAFMAGLITLLHAEQLWLADLLHAELPYTLVTVTFFALWGVATPGIRNGAAGILAGAAFLLRTAGIALLAAWVGDSLLRGRYRQAALRCALALLPFLGWQIHVAQVRSDLTYEAGSYPYQRAAYQYYNVSYVENLLYVDSFQPELGRVSGYGLAGRIASNLVGMPVALGEAVSSRADWARSELRRLDTQLPVPIPLAIAYLPPLALAVGVLAGLGLFMGRREWIIPLYVAGSIALISLTPWPGQFARYVAPLTPVLVVSLLVALDALRRRYSYHARWGPASGAILPVILCGIMVLQLFPAYKTYDKREMASWRTSDGERLAFPLFYYRADWQSHERVVDWLGEAAAPGEVVVTSTPHWLYLRTGLPAVMPPFTPDVEEAQRLIDAVPASFVIVDNLEFVDVTRRYARPVVEAYPHHWQLVFASPDSASRVYRRTAEAGNTASFPRASGFR